MKAMKTRGMDDVLALRRRVTRLSALRRIGKEDHDYIAIRLDEIETRIIEMRERNVEEEPF